MDVFGPTKYPLALALKKYSNSVVAEQYQQAYEAAVSGSAS